MILAVARWIISAVAIVGLGLSSWIVIPAPTMALLPLAVVAPEISPLLGVSSIVVAIATLLLPWSSRWWLLPMGCSIAGIVLSSLPLLQLSSTIQQTNAQMQVLLGTDVDESFLTPPSSQREQLRARPFIPLDLLQGIAASRTGQGKIERKRHHIQVSEQGSLAIDIYYPASHPATGSELRQRLPTIVTIYGGAWQVGQPDDTADFSDYMSRQGYVVVAIAYRHAPQHHFPTQLQDVQTCLQWLLDHADEHRVDPGRIALVGWSAGAHLAMLAAYQSGGPQVRSVVNYYGPVNLTQGYFDIPQPDPIDARAVLETLMGGTPDQLPEHYKDASPITYVKPGLPPTLLLYGDRDHLVKPVFGQQLHQKLLEAGNLSILIRLPWSEHGFDEVWRGMGNQMALYYVERFLAWTLR